MPVSRRELLLGAGATMGIGACADAQEYTEEQAAGPLTLVVYPGSDGELTLYHDDGISFNYRKGDWMGIRAVWQDTERRLALRLAAGSRMMVSSREIDVRV